MFRSYEDTQDSTLLHIKIGILLALKNEQKAKDLLDATRLGAVADQFDLPGDEKISDSYKRLRNEYEATK